MWITSYIKLGWRKTKSGSQTKWSTPFLQYGNIIHRTVYTRDKIETESMADRATRAALDAEKEFKKFLDDLNQYEYMKVYDDEQKVGNALIFASDIGLFKL